MNRILSLVLLATAGSLCAADKPAAPEDPLAGAFFPPEHLLLARDQLGLTAEQQQSLIARMQQAKTRSDELRQRLERETAAMAALAKLEHVDEAALHAQLDKVLDAERELKHQFLGAVAFAKNLLTPEQQSKLREIEKDGGAQLMESTRKRLTDKIERINQGMQKWAAGGHDPSAIGKTMTDKVKPLIDAGNVSEAEAEMDRILEQLK